MSSSAGSAPFLVTKEYRRFAEFCDACRCYRYIGLCYGPPGVGKTLSARHYTHWDQVEECAPNWIPSSSTPPPPGLAVDMRFHTVFFTPRVANSPGQIEREIERLRKDVQMLSWYQRSREQAQPQDGEEKESDTRTRNLSISETVADPTTLVIVDEADRLKMAGLEQMRDIFDREGVGLVLIGMPGLEKRLSRYGQLYSRVGFVHAFRPLAEAEMRHLLGEKWRQMGLALTEGDFTDEEAAASILRITGGNFRLLHRLLAQVERILQINELRTVTREVVEAAREGLVIGNV